MDDISKAGAALRTLNDELEASRQRKEAWRESFDKHLDTAKRIVDGINAEGGGPRSTGYTLSATRAKTGTEGIEALMVSVSNVLTDNRLGENASFAVFRRGAALVFLPEENGMVGVGMALSSRFEIGEAGEDVRSTLRDPVALRDSCEPSQITHHHLQTHIDEFMEFAVRTHWAGKTPAKA